MTPLEKQEAAMKTTGKITRESLMTLEAYSRYRKDNKPAIIAHRKLRSVRLGEHINLQFESETSIRYQIQEMLRVEKIFEEEGIEQEIEAYAPLVPDGGNWKGTLMLEYPDINERKRELARLIGVEDRMFVEVEGHPRVYAIADEDMRVAPDRALQPAHLFERIVHRVVARIVHRLFGAPDGHRRLGGDFVRALHRGRQHGLG